MRAFELIALTPPGICDPTIAISAAKAGFCGILDLEEFAGFKIESSRHDVCRKHLPAIIILHDIFIVVLPGKTNFVFGRGQFLLQCAKVGIGFQVRVIFDQHHQAPKGSA